MNPKSAEALVGLAVGLNLLAFLVMSPTAWFYMSALAVVVALIPAIFARKGPRIAAFVVPAVSIAQSVWSYPAHDRFYQQYIKRAKKNSQKNHQPASPPAAQEEKK